MQGILRTPGITTYKQSEDTIESTLSDYFRNVKKKFLKKHMHIQIDKESIIRLKDKERKNYKTSSSICNENNYENSCPL